MVYGWLDVFWVLLMAIKTGWPVSLLEMLGSCTALGSCGQRRKWFLCYRGSRSQVGRGGLLAFLTEPPRSWESTKMLLLSAPCARIRDCRELERLVLVGNRGRHRPAPTGPPLSVRVCRMLSSAACRWQSPSPVPAVPQHEGVDSINALCGQLDRADNLHKSQQLRKEWLGELAHDCRLTVLTRRSTF